MVIDWLRATCERDERKALYRRTKCTVDLRFAGNWSAFYGAALGAVSLGIGYQNNFRAKRLG